MSEALLSVILDGLILVFLGLTVFFAGRLSLHLKQFRSTRKELEGLLASLSSSIVRAEGAITGMKETAQESGRDLQDRIDEARKVLDELQLIEEAGNSLAARLETLAERSGRASRSSSPSPSGVGFSIRDPEFDRGTGAAEGEGEGEGEVEEGESFEAVDDDRSLFSQSLHSRAERELYDAINQPAGGRS
ncbi:MAG: hypothetical protein KDJ15_03850 [Alphaproteobacteria bacterium]|nr:hypothetical protein [Alphaproteobacteria bacterium]